MPLTVVIGKNLDESNPRATAARDLFLTMYEAQSESETNKIKQIIESDPNLLYSLYLDKTPLEHSIYFKSWNVAKLFIELEDKDRLIKHYTESPVINLMVEHNAPALLIQLALTKQPLLWQTLSPKNKTNLEKLSIFKKFLL